MDSYYEKNKDKLREYAKIDISQTMIKQNQENATILARQDFKNSRKIFIETFQMKKK